MIVFRESQWEGFRFADFQTDGGRFEFRQHAAFAQHEAVVVRFAAREFDVVDGTDEIDGDFIAVLRAQVSTAVAVFASFALGVVVHALFAQDIDGFIDFGFRHFSLDRFDLDRGQVADDDFRIHFEGGVEGQLAFGRLFLRFDFRITGHAQIVFVGGIVECAADFIVQHFGFDLITVLCGDHF